MPHSKKELEEMTVADLRELAKDEGIVLGADATTKTDIIDKIQEGAGAPSPSEEEEPRPGASSSAAPSLEGFGRNLDLEAFGGEVPWDEKGPAKKDYDLREDELKDIKVGGFKLGPRGWEVASK